MYVCTEVPREEYKFMYYDCIYCMYIRMYVLYVCMYVFIYVVCMYVCT